MLKRVFDLIASGLGLFFLSPVFLATVVLVRFKLGSPVFFTQRRPGLNEIPFLMIKFRTMTNECDEKGEFLPDEKRITTFGQWLRSTSIDELPELWNVFCGNMSLVGPRPLLIEYLPLYSPQQARRHEVRPGITGWAQVNGRNSLGWKEKFVADVWYVDNRSFFLDIKILLKTVGAIVQQKGISHSNEATMPQFLGNRDIK